MRRFLNKTDGPRAGRTYSVWMQPDLFGEWVVLRIHGGRMRAGRMIVTPVENRVKPLRRFGKLEQKA